MFAHNEKKMTSVHTNKQYNVRRSRKNSQLYSNY